MKIRFVQLESDAFLTDIDFMRFSPAERGVYLSLILFLNCNGGKCPFDTSALSRLCNCESAEEFEKIWTNIAKKFQTRNGVIKHKRVTKELAKARKHRQAKRAAGLKGAEKRWQTDGTANGDAIAKERKGNVIEKESEDTSNTNTTEHALSSSTSVRTRYTAESQRRALDFNEALTGIIRPRTQSDRTCFHNVTKWLVEGCAAGRFNEAIFGRVLDYAREASEGRNPAAVFMALLKKELGYKNG
ncbi:MAG: DUF1376 domain-containing protein [Planctomycetota bacterium]